MTHSITLTHPDGGVVEIHLPMDAGIVGKVMARLGKLEFELHPQNSDRGQRPS